MAYINDNQIGEVTEVTGAAIVIRTDGTTDTVTLGTEIFEGDIVETSDGGAINIGFIDDSSFAVSSDARVAIDEFIFDPASESGAQDFSVMKGVFMYTSGLIGRENPDSVEIDTPVGSIGIRGTIIGGNIDPDGESQVTVIEGAIVVRNNGGEQLLSTQYDTVRLNSIDTAPSNVETLSVERVANDYGAVKDVSAELFSSFNDQINEQGASEGLDESSVSEEVQAEAEAEEQTEDLNASETTDGAQTIEMKSMESKDGEKQDTESNKGNQALELRDSNIAGEPTLIKTVKEFGRGDLVFKTGGSVDENAGANQSVGTVERTGGSNATLTYALSDDAGGLFLINATTGEITLDVAAGDYEAAADKFYDIRIIATEADSGQSKEFDLRINLNDLNDETPTNLTLSNNAIGEDATGSVIGTLSATDADADDTLSYAIETDASGLFEVVGTDLKLKSGATLDFETAQTHNIDIRVTDAAGNSSLQTFTVNVSDVNDETPTNLTLSNNAIGEDATGSVIGTLSATDADADDTLSYAIETDASGLFEVVGTDLKLKSGATLDFETAQTHNIDIRVTDAAGNSSLRTFTVNVSDVNETAEITDATINTINEGVLANDVVAANLTFTEVDNVQTTTFGTNDSRFAVQMNGGQLQLVALDGAVFDFEGESSVIVSIIQSDDTNVYGNYDVTVNIGDLIDETPTDITLDNNIVSENAIDGTVVATLTTTDADASDTHTYTIENDVSGLFEVIGNEIRVKSGADINYESATDHTFDVVTTDQNGLSYTKSVTLNVQNINEVYALKLALKDVYDMSGSIKGVIAEEVDGAIIGEIKIDADDVGQFDASDFNITGQYLNNSYSAEPLSDIFEIIENNGAFILKLKDAYSIESTNEIHNSGGKIGSLTISGDGVATIGVEMGGHSYDLDFAARIVTNINDHIASEGDDFKLQNVDGVVFGTDGDDNFVVKNANFKLIRGGDGYDTLRFDDKAGGNDDILNLTSKASNITGAFSADLKGIEEIIISNASNEIENTLRMNISDVLDLLRTSDTKIGGKNIFKITAANFTEHSEKSTTEFYVSGTHQQLDTIDIDGDAGADFVANGTVTDNGHTYYVFEHDLGNVLLDANLSNGATG